MADSSFDIVSKYDKQEVANAVNTAAKEVANRYDFKNVGARVELAGEVIKIEANTEERCKAVLDVVETWLIKRGVSLKHLDIPEAGPRLSGKEYKLDISLKEGISSENAKKITKIIRDEGPKSVKTQIQGDEVRVTSKSRDDLQAVQRLLNEADLEVALQLHEPPLTLRAGAALGPRPGVISGARPRRDEHGLLGELEQVADEGADVRFADGCTTGLPDGDQVGAAVRATWSRAASTRPVTRTAARA